MVVEKPVGNPFAVVAAVAAVGAGALAVVSGGAAVGSPVGRLGA